MEVLLNQKSQCCARVSKSADVQSAGRLERRTGVRSSLSVSLLAAVAVGSLLGAGCGKGLTTATGSVTFDDEPVQQGTIQFESPNGKAPTAGGQIESGQYTVTGALEMLTGEKIVRIQAYRETGRKIPAGSPAPPGTMVDEIAPFIPAIYNNQSQLTVELAAGVVNQHDFDLSSKP